MFIQEQSRSSKETSDPNSHSLLTEEYSALRDEILKRIEMQHQIISLSLIAPGTILTIGVQTANASIVLVYPILALFLSAIWFSHSYKIHRMEAYIMEQVEGKVREDAIGWEHYDLLHPHISSHNLINFLGTRGIFISTQLLTLLVGLSIEKDNPVDHLLLAIAIVSTLLTAIILFFLPTHPKVPQTKQNVPMAHQEVGRQHTAEDNSASPLTEA